MLDFGCVLNWIFYAAMIITHSFVVALLHHCPLPARTASRSLVIAQSLRCRRNRCCGAVSVSNRTAVLAAFRIKILCARSCVSRSLTMGHSKH